LVMVTSPMHQLSVGTTCYPVWLRTLRRSISRA